MYCWGDCILLCVWVCGVVDMEKFAKAKKNGRLECGDLFCWKGDVYSYRVEGFSSHPIHMKNICSNDHQMGYEFFDEYFICIDDDEFLEEKEFEI